MRSVVFKIVLSDKLVIKAICLIMWLSVLPLYADSYFGHLYKIPSERNPEQVLSVSRSPSGLLYCGTDRGIYLFDGRNAHRIQTGDSVNVVTSIFCKGDKDVYFISNLGLHHFDGNRASLLSKGEFKYISGSASLNNVFILSVDGRIYRLSVNTLGLIASCPPDLKTYCLRVDSKGGVYAVGHNGFAYASKRNTVLVSVKMRSSKIVDGNIFVAETPLGIQAWSEGVNYTVPNNNTLDHLFFKGSTLVDFKGNEFFLSADEQFLKNPFFADYIYDNSGTIWVPTFVGLLEVKKQWFISRNHVGLLPVSVRAKSIIYSGQVPYVIGDDLNIYSSSGHRFVGKKLQDLGLSQQSLLQVLPVGNDDFLLLFADRIIYISKKDQIADLSALDNNPLNEIWSFAIEVSDSEVMIIGQNHLLRLDLTDLKSSLISYPLSGKDLIINHAVFVDNTLFLATATGLYSMKNGYWTQVPGTVSMDIRNVCYLNGRLFFNTDKNVVFSLNISDSRIQKLNLNFDQHVISIVAFRNSNLLFSTSTGFYQFHLATATVRYFDYTYFGLSESDRDAQLLMVDTDRSAVWSGLTEIALSNEFIIDKVNFNNYKPVAYFIETEDQETNGQRLDDWTLSYSKNGLEFKVIIPPIVLNSIHRVEYVLDDSMSANWQILTGDGHLYFDKLNDGQHTLYVKYVTLSGESIVFQVFSWQVRPPLYRSKSMILLYTSMVFPVFLFGRRYYQRKVAQKQALRIEILENKLKGLRTQLDPHFVGNLLHTAQGMILRSDQLSAIQMISEYAQILRYGFESMNSEWVLLKDELTFLRNYAEFKAGVLGIENKTILWDVQPGLSESVQSIPAMILQPLIENSIKHGRSADGDLFLSVSIKMDKGLVCIITDRGPGFEYVNSSTKQTSLFIISKRIQLLADVYPGLASLCVENSPGEGCSIKVVLPLYNK